MITTFYPPYNFGGDGLFVYRLSNELARRGHSVDVIHCSDAFRALEPREPAISFYNHPNIRVYKLKSVWGRLSPLATYHSGRPSGKAENIKEILAEGRHQVIHFHNISLVGGPNILEYGDPAAVKLYTTHEYWLVCPTHVLFKWGREVCTKRSCFLCTLVHKRPPQLWRYTDLLGRALGHVDRFIAPSRFVIEAHKERGLDLPFTHIPHFLSRSEAMAVAAGRPERPFFLYAGRMEKIKGVERLIEIFRIYDKADLWMVGSGRYKKKLMRMAGRSPHIKFLGPRSYRDLKALYAQATAVLIPSLAYEVFGMVAIEAFAAQTPVIASDRGGLPELIEQSNGGFVFKTGEELIQAMEALRRDEQLRARLGKNGYEAYLKYWTEDSYMEQYFRLISEIQEQKKQESLSADNAHLR
jgi:glycosyltransferase involved in cell wall biosynthesis